MVTVYDLALIAVDLKVSKQNMESKWLYINYVIYTILVIDHGTYLQNVFASGTLRYFYFYLQLARG